ncbi:Histone-lysine N-methyltransferase ATX2 [Bienertia sinuspersici]
MVNFDDEFNSDGLEILSIGALYTGAWDKKYWSSSRGKDRYPYPVGYQALRTHKGITYKMEIHEGSKGPKFQITSNDKQCGSGETPDRACDNFQKKCCSRIKLWHGKRSSGKIDGVEEP